MNKENRARLYTTFIVLVILTALIVVVNTISVVPEKNCLTPQSGVLEIQKAYVMTQINWTGYDELNYAIKKEKFIEAGCK